MIILGSDHGGFQLKELVKNFFNSQNASYSDVGTYDENLVDYPDYALKVALQVVSNENNLGILCCGTGIGMSIAANKIPGVRAALCQDVFCAEMARRHNNANILCLGGRVLEPDTAIEMVRTFLITKFDGGRHAVRLEKIRSIETKGSIINE